MTSWRVAGVLETVWHHSWPSSEKESFNGWQKRIKVPQTFPTARRQNRIQDFFSFLARIADAAWSWTTWALRTLGNLLSTKIKFSELFHSQKFSTDFTSFSPFLSSCLMTSVGLLYRTKVFWFSRVFSAMIWIYRKTFKTENSSEQVGKRAENVYNESIGCCDEIFQHEFLSNEPNRIQQVVGIVSIATYFDRVSLVKVHSTLCYMRHEKAWCRSRFAFSFLLKEIFIEFHALLLRMFSVRVVSAFTKTGRNLLHKEWNACFRQVPVLLQARSWLLSDRNRRLCIVLYRTDNLIVTAFLRCSDCWWKTWWEIRSIVFS